MNIKPLNDRILVERIKEKEMTEGGLYIPEGAREKPAEGKVIAVGSGALDDNGIRVPLEVKVGNRVLFGKYGGQEINIEDKKYLIMKEQDVFCVIDD